MNTRRQTAFLLIAGLTVGLTACAGPSEGGDGDTELLVWDAGLLTKVTEDEKIDTASSFLHQAASEFEDANPGVTVKIVRSTGDISTNSAQFQAASIAGNGPDIRTGYTGGNTLSFADFLLDLDPVLSDETKADLSGLTTVREDYQEDGRLLGLPYGGGSYFYVFYDRAKVEEAGIDLSTPPESWEALLDMGEQAKEAGQTPFWVANQEGYVGAWVIAALVGGELGGTAFTDMYNGDIPVDDPAMVKAYEAYAELYARGLTNPDAGSVSNGDALAGYVQGKGTFYISGSWENGEMEKALGDSVGVFPIPMLDGAKFPNTVAGGPNVAVSITNYAKQPELAKEFLNYLAEPETIDLYVELFQTEASNSAQADPSVITNALLQSEAEQLISADNTVFPFDNVMPQAVIDLFYKVNATTFLGTTTPQDAASQLADAFEKESVGE